MAKKLYSINQQIDKELTLSIWYSAIQKKKQNNIDTFKEEILFNAAKKQFELDFHTTFNELDIFQDICDNQPVTKQYYPKKEYLFLADIK